MKILLIFRKLLSLLLAHLNACYQPSEPVIEAPSYITRSNFHSEYPKFLNYQNCSNRVHHRMYILPILVQMYFVLDSLWILYRNGFDYDNDLNNELISRRMFPSMFRSYGDQIVWAVVLTGLVVYPYCWLGQFLADKYVMIVVQNSGDSKDGHCLFVNGKGKMMKFFISKITKVCNFF